MRSLIVGADGGIGSAVARALGERGEVVALGRASGPDVMDETDVRQHLAALDGSFDLIFVATGALGAPEKSLRAFAADAFLRQMLLNTAGPLPVLKHAQHLLPRDRRAVFAALSARVGSIGDNALGGWYSYRAAKAALNQLLHTAAIEMARSHRHAVVAALHPGTVDTRFTAGYGHNKATPDQAAAHLLAVIDRLTPAQSGGFFDWSGAPVPW